jgi:hypothetical protein
VKKWLALFLLVPFAAIAAVGPLVNATTLTITAGGTWQTMFAKNQNRSTLWIENPCSATTQGIAAAESLFVAFGAAPNSGTSGTFEIAPCGSLVMSNQYISQQIIYVYGATAGHAFVAAQTQ